MACTAPPTTEPNGERSAAPDSLPVEDDDDSDDGDEMVEINIFNDMVNVDYEPLPTAKISPGIGLGGQVGRPCEGEETSHHFLLLQLQTGLHPPHG